MQLTGPEILRRMQLQNPHNPDGKPDITITPFDEKCLGSNSYDLHLGKQLKIYKNTLPFAVWHVSRTGISQGTRVFYARLVLGLQCLFGISQIS